ncbi:MAG: hypothetical protein FJY74_04120 [Candidatus Eisenbacteria bacterium]|nr:hypothetical protein [Candidatus Eisenbacteria bacterium]
MGAKVPFAVLLFALGWFALVSALRLLGGSGRGRLGPDALRVIHRIAGYAFALCLVVLVVAGAHRLAVAGDQISVRAVFHIVLALGGAALLAVKVLIARSHRQLLKYAPALGLVVFALAFVTVAISAGLEALVRR